MLKLQLWLPLLTPRREISRDLHLRRVWSDGAVQRGWVAHTIGRFRNPFAPSFWRVGRAGPRCRRFVRMPQRAAIGHKIVGLIGFACIPNAAIGKAFLIRFE